MMEKRAWGSSSTGLFASIGEEVYLWGKEKSKAVGITWALQDTWTFKVAFGHVDPKNHIQVGCTSTMKGLRPNIVDKMQRFVFKDRVINTKDLNRGNFRKNVASICLKTMGQD